MTPNGWASATIGDLLHSVTTGVSVNSQGRPRSQGEIGVLKTSAVTYGTFRPEENKAVVPEDLERARQNPEAGCVLFSRMNTLFLVGASVFVPRHFPDLFLPDRIWQLRPVEDRVDGGWLHRLLSSPPMRTRLSEIASGTSGSMKNISQGKFLNLTVLVPSLGEQRKIASILSCVDDAIECTQAVIGQLQVVKMSMMAELLTRGLPGRHTRFKQTEIGEMPEEWTTARVGELLKETAYGTSVKCEVAAKGFPVLRIPNVVNGRVTTDDLKYATLGATEIDAYRLRPGDLLVIRSNGNPAYVGRSAVFPELEGVYLYASYLIRVRPKTELVTPEFLHEAMRSVNARKTMQGAIRTSAGNYNLNTQGIANTIVPLPPLAEQAEITAMESAIEDRLGTEADNLSGLLATKAALMSVLLTGELRVTPDEATP